MSGTIQKELRPFVEKARAAGWRERRSKSGLVLYPPNGARPIAVHGSSSSKGRTIENAKQQFRAGGLDV